MEKNPPNHQKIQFLRKVPFDTTAQQPDKPKVEKNPHPGQEKLTPVTALMSSTKPKLGAEKCIDGIEDGKDSQAGDKVNLCHTLVKKEGDKFIAEPFPWFAIDYGEEARVSVGKTVLVNRLVFFYFFYL